MSKNSMQIYYCVYYNPKRFTMKELSHDPFCNIKVSVVVRALAYCAEDPWFALRVGVPTTNGGLWMHWGNKAVGKGTGHPTSQSWWPPE